MLPKAAAAIEMPRRRSSRKHPGHGDREVQQDVKLHAEMNGST